MELGGGWRMTPRWGYGIRQRLANGPQSGVRQRWRVNEMLDGPQRPAKSNTRATVSLQQGQRRDDGQDDQRDDQRRRTSADNGPASDLLVE